MEDKNHSHSHTSIVTQLDEDIRTLEKCLVSITGRHEAWDISYNPTKRIVYITLYDTSIDLDQLSQVYDEISQWRVPVAITYDISTYTLLVHVGAIY